MFENIMQALERSNAWRRLLVVGALVFIVEAIFLLNAGFAAGIGLLLLLGFGTIWGLRKLGMGERHVILLFALTLLVHAFTASFIYFADFQPLSGGQGDYGSYHKSAENISYQFWQGDFITTEKERDVWHYYPVVIATVYAILFPSIIIGQLFNVWIAALAIVALYFIVREAGGSKNWAFAIGAIGSVYPSFLFYTSLLLKDVVVVFLALLGLLLALRMLQRFSWQSFALLYLTLIPLTNFRFYVGIILIAAFLISWILVSSLEWRKRLAYAAIMVPLIGFIPHMNGEGYFGIARIIEYATPQQVKFYKEVVYAPEVAPELQAEREKQQQEPQEPIAQETPKLPMDTSFQPGSGTQNTTEDLPETDEPKPEKKQVTNVENVNEAEEAGYNSSVDLRIRFDNPFVFATSFVKSFAFASVGPWPSQLTAPRHYLVLAETLPWYVLLFFIGRGILYAFWNKRQMLVLVLFSIGLFTLLAVFFSNFGITTRIRIPAFLALLPFIPLAFYTIRRSIKQKAE